MKLCYIKYKSKKSLLKIISLFNAADILVIPYNKKINDFNDIIENLKEKFKEQQTLIFLCFKNFVYIIFKGETIKIINMNQQGYVRIVHDFFNVGLICGLNIYNKQIAKNIMLTKPRLVIGLDDDRVYLPSEVLRIRYKNKLWLFGNNNCYSCGMHKLKINENIYQYIVQ